MSSPNGIQLNISNDLIFDIQEALGSQITTLNQILLENHPEVSLDIPIDELLVKYKNRDSIYDLCYRIKKLTYILNKVDEYVFELD